MSRLRELVRKAREAGHDTLGIGSDPETLVALAKACRQRVFAEADADALESWRQVIEDLAASAAEDVVSREWIEMQQMELDLARRKLAEAAGPAVPLDQRSAREPIAHEGSRVSDEARQEIAALAELAWATGVAARAGG